MSPGSTLPFPLLRDTPTASGIYGVFYGRQALWGPSACSAVHFQQTSPSSRESSIRVQPKPPRGSATRPTNCSEHRRLRASTAFRSVDTYKRCCRSFGGLGLYARTGIVSCGGRRPRNSPLPPKKANSGCKDTVNDEAGENEEVRVQCTGKVGIFV